MTLTPDWFHGLWAAIAALFWKLWDTHASRLEKLSDAVGKLEATSATHDTLHASTAQAITELKTAVQENTKETRRIAESSVRIETLIETALKKD